MPWTFSVLRSGLWLYKDGAHLSWAGALTLVDDFSTLIHAHATPGLSGTPSAPGGSPTGS